MDGLDGALWGIRALLALILLARLVAMASGTSLQRGELSGLPRSDAPHVAALAGALALSFSPVEPWLGPPRTAGSLPARSVHVLLLALVAQHQLGLAGRLYRHLAYHWLTHAFGGFTITTLAFAYAFPGPVTPGTAFAGVATGFAVSVLWECYELIITDRLGAEAWYHHWDMVLDLSAGTQGAGIAVLVRVLGGV